MKNRKIDPILVIGIIISVAIAIILVLTGQDEALSLLIGLSITIITLLIDVISRIDTNRDRLMETYKLSSTLATDTKLSAIIGEIIEYYLRIKESGFITFQERSDDLLLEYRDILDGMAKGRMRVDTRSKYTYGRKGILSAQKSIKAVSYADPSFWRSDYAKGYLDANAQTAQRIPFTRVWLQKKETLIDYEDIIRQQQELGLEVFVATPDELPKQLLEDYMIVDESVLVRLELSLDGHSRSEVISTDPVELDQAKHNFELLLRYARPIDEFFASVSQNE